jgi:hypothetical protein
MSLCCVAKVGSEFQKIVFVVPRFTRGKMITCERFEKDFEAWQSGKLNPEDEALIRQHVRECPHCQAFNQAAFRVRELTLALPEREPSAAFRYRLGNRLGELTAPPVKPLHARGRLLPRWAALGAGLASGLALGLILVLSTGPENESSPGLSVGTGQLASNEEKLVKDADTADVADDSAKITDRSYDLDTHSQVVSGRK